MYGLGEDKEMKAKLKIIQRMIRTTTVRYNKRKIIE